MTDAAKTVLTLDDLRARREEILRLAAKYGAYNVRVFGSVARGEATPESDVENKMKECLYCKGHLEEKLVSRVQEYHGQWYLIEHIPALVCKQCGETFYTPAAHSLILHLVRDSAKPVRLETLAVLDAS